MRGNQLPTHVNFAVTRGQKISEKIEWKIPDHVPGSVFYVSGLLYGLARFMTTMAKPITSNEQMTLPYR